MVAGAIPSQVLALLDEERGLVLAAWTLRDARRLVASVTGEAGARCRSAVAALGALDRERRAEVLAWLTRAVLSPFADDLAWVHPTWLQEVLAAEPTTIVRAVMAGAPPAVQAAGAPVLSGRDPDPSASDARFPPHVVADLQRFLFARFAVGRTPPPGTRAEALAALPPPALLAEVTRCGAETLGASLAGAPREALARACASVGPAWSQLVSARARTAAAQERARAQEAVLAVSASAAGVAEERLQRLGARILGGELAAEGDRALAAVAFRLPGPIGRQLWPRDTA